MVRVPPGSQVATAFRRRSFALLTSATVLATTVQLSMDQVLVGMGKPPPRGGASPLGLAAPKGQCMDYLLPILLTPAWEQRSAPSRLRWQAGPRRYLCSCARAGVCVWGGQILSKREHSRRGRDREREPTKLSVTPLLTAPPFSPLPAPSSLFSRISISASTRRASRG